MSKINVREAEVVMLKCSADANADIPHVNFQAALDDTKRRMTCEMHARLHAMPLDTVSARWPADWKEAVKERFFPAWLKKRYPVRYNGIEKKLFGPICPHLATDDQSKHLQWLEMRMENHPPRTETQYWTSKITSLAYKEKRGIVRQHVMHSRASAAHEIVSRLERTLGIPLDDARKWAESMRAEG